MTAGLEESCYGRVIRDIEREVALQQAEAGQAYPGLKRLLEIAKRIHAQRRRKRD